VTVATGDRLQRDMVMAMGGAVIGADSLRNLARAAQAELGEHSARRRREAGFANRLEDRLDPGTRSRLDKLRRPPPEPPDEQGGQVENP
jgi:predicted RNA-binding protein with PIN domain